MHLKQCQIINLPKIADPRGNLTFIEGNRTVRQEKTRMPPADFIMSP